VSGEYSIPYVQIVSANILIKLINFHQGESSRSVFTSRNIDVLETIMNFILLVNKTTRLKDLKLKRKSSKCKSNSKN